MRGGGRRGRQKKVKKPPYMSLQPEGVCTDHLLSRKPENLAFCCHSRAFCWFFAAPLVSCSLVFFLFICLLFRRCSISILVVFPIFKLLK